VVFGRLPVWFVYFKLCPLLPERKSCRGGGEARARKDDKQVTKVLLFGLLLGDLFCFSSAHYFAQKEVLLLLHITLKILKVKFSLQTKGVIDS
jgi:hypothetical protein